MLRRRGKTYTARAFVPVDLQPLMHRAEIVKSMGTQDRDDAVLLAAEWNHRVLKLFSRLKTDGPQMTTDDIDNMVARYLSVKMDGTEAELATPDQTHDGLEAVEWRLQDQLETAEMDLKYNRFAAIRKDALGLLGATSVDEDSDSFRVLCRRLLEARLEALWAELRARQGGTLKRPTRTHTAPAIIPVGTQSPAGPLLSKAFATFNDTEGARKKWRPQTRDDHGLVQRVLLDFLGDKPVADVTKANLLDWLKMARKIPMKRGAEFNGMTIPAIVKATEGQDRLRIADKTINARYISCTKAFFSYAEKVDWVVKSPATALDPIKLAKARKNQKGFTPEELAKVFGGLREAATRANHEGYYWVAVLALHSGARLDEVAGLLLTDIRQTEGTLCMHFDESGGRHIKNEFGTRVVPIHSRVLALGFDEYFRAQKGPRLVSNITKSKLGKYGGPISAFFNEYLADIGVKTSRDKNFHSLRHTWRTATDRAGIPEAHADALGGWAATGSEGRKTYTGDQLIPMKAELIERLRFI